VDHFYMNTLFKEQPGVLLLWLCKIVRGEKRTKIVEGTIIFEKYDFWSTKGKY